MIKKNIVMFVVVFLSFNFSAEQPEIKSTQTHSFETNHHPISTLHTICLCCIGAVALWPLAITTGAIYFLWRVKCIIFSDIV